ncbi:CPBP family intramembrane glutamic endopeptidase [Flavobacterium sp.]|uniref:CPBP family intramembrane glutamic endopeptidase n=1 Tax=Flavobacterium sp. TaxID=239 RepID=UPI00404840B4
MTQILKIIGYNIFYVFTIVVFQSIFNKLFQNSITIQFLLIIFYIFFLFPIFKIAKYDFKELYFNKDFYRNVFINFSVFTVVYFVFDKTDLIEASFNLSDNKNNFHYFILLPIELFVVSILEELFFRKFMFFKLGNFNDFSKIFISSLLFSLSHFPDKIIDFLLLFCSAVTYGIIYIKTKDIKYSISLHVATNLSIVFFGLHDEKNFSSIVLTTNTFNILDNSFNSSELIILICELIILSYFIFKTNDYK